MSDRNGEEQFRNSLDIINDELHALLSGAVRLRAIYGEAATASDLTFVKILEEQYNKLSEELGELSAVVGNVQAGFNQREEAIENGW